MEQQWLKQTLGQGMAMLLVLRLKNAPPEDAVKATLQAWFKVITYKKAWEQALDQPRFEAAFMYLAQHCEWFPTPKQLLEAMPARKVIGLPPPPTISAAQRAKNQAKLSELLQSLKRGVRCKG